MDRILIVGSCGCGKTTLGRRLAKHLGIPVTDLDDLYWLPGWEPRPLDEFVELVGQVASEPKWIICGNQSKIRALFLPKTTKVIWLDLPFWTLFRRIVGRSFRQMRTGEMICGGNQQQIFRFFPLLRWLIVPYRRRKRTYAALSAGQEHWVQLKSQAQVDRWFDLTLASRKEGEAEALDQG